MFIDESRGPIFSPLLQWGFEDLYQEMMAVLPYLVMHQPAIYRVLTAGDIGCVIRKQEKCDSRCFFRGSCPAEGDLADNKILKLLTRLFRHEMSKVRFDRTRYQRIGANTPHSQRRGPSF